MRICSGSPIGRFGSIRNRTIETRRFRGILLESPHRAPSRSSQTDLCSIGMDVLSTAGQELHHFHGQIRRRSRHSSLASPSRRSFFRHAGCPTWSDSSVAHGEPFSLSTSLPSLSFSPRSARLDGWTRPRRAAVLRVVTARSGKCHPAFLFAPRRSAPDCRETRIGWESNEE